MPQILEGMVFSAMAAASSFMMVSSAKVSTTNLGYNIGRRELRMKKRRSFSISAQKAQESPEQELNNNQDRVKQQQGTPLRPVETQVNVKSKNMSREYGGQWLSSVTRHVRIYAAYIDPVTCEFDQTQMDKLTLILDPTNEFVWNSDTCNKVYSYFQELVDHYET
uniref:NAD(P)H-quinone oxidoreductase subunit M, chloroplastic n=1 Tax=Cannabis sativa TaxID=3483 RepID=A0A803NM34_CANSA